MTRSQTAQGAADPSFIMTQHAWEGWYIVREVQPAPHAIHALPSLRAQVAATGAPPTATCDDLATEAGRLLDILTYEHSVPQNLGDALYEEMGGPIPDSALHTARANANLPGTRRGGSRLAAAVPPSHLGPARCCDADKSTADPRMREIHECLAVVLQALARLGVYLMDTDHLTDDELLAYICGEILPCEYRGIGAQLFPVGDAFSGDIRKVARRDHRLPRPRGAVDFTRRPAAEH